MTAIFLNDDHSRLKSYTATVKGPMAVVTIVLEVNDPTRLGFLLEDLGRSQAENERRKQREKQEAKAARKPKAVERKTMLSLPYFGKDEA